MKNIFLVFGMSLVSLSAFAGDYDRVQCVQSISPIVCTEDGGNDFGCVAENFVCKASISVKEKGSDRLTVYQSTGSFSPCDTTATLKWFQESEAKKQATAQVTQVLNQFKVLPACPGATSVNPPDSIPAD